MENTGAGPLAAARIIVLACLAREFCEAERADSDHVVRTMLAFGRYRDEIRLVAPRPAPGQGIVQTSARVVVVAMPRSSWTCAARLAALARFTLRRAAVFLTGRESR